MARKIRWLCIDMLQRPKTLYILLVAYISFFLNIRTKPIKLKVIDFNINKSFIRWWDGETLILLWISFSYQKASFELSRKFKEFFYCNSNKVILWMPIEYITKKEEQTKYLRARLITRYYLNKHIDRRRKYWDAFYFINLGNISVFKNLYKWKKLFIVANNETIKKIKESDLKNNIIWYNEIPYRNAYLKYNEIKQSILRDLENIDRNNLIIIISSWPTAKVLCYDLTIEEDFICHDVGSYFDRNL